MASRRANVAAGLTLLLAAALAAGAVAGAASGAVAVTLALAVAYALLQCGRAFARVSFPALYPRDRYYGEADIAPEAPGAERAARRRAVVSGYGATAAALVTGALAAIAGLQAWIECVALALGIGSEIARTASRRATRVEERLRGRYVLYLRSFARARPSMILATVLAAGSDPALAIATPRRAEARSLPWYLLAVLFPVQFERIVFWATSDADWHRVVASCMNASRAMVFDCTAVDGAAGLEIEIGMSVAFGSKRPIAYVTAHGVPMPVRVPGPSTLKTTSTLRWWVRRFPAFVRRLRAVLDRDLTAEELAYLDRYHAQLLESWEAAMIRDRNLASREERRDPHDVLMSRDPRASMLDELQDPPPP